MKKKISLILCMLAVVLGLTACGGSKEELQYDEDTLGQASEFLIDYCLMVDDATAEQLEEMPEFNLQLQLTQAGLPYTPESFLGAIEAWNAATDECGVYVSHGDYTYEVSGDEIHVTTDAEFEERSATITFIYDEDMYLDSLTVDADYTLGEIMKKAGLNTVLGMGTVFVVLIFISVLISFFKYIPMVEEAFKKRKHKQGVQPAPDESKAVEAAVEAAAEDDTELVAVIAAAIAAAEGTSTDGFVVRSIRRRPSNKWNSNS